MTSELLLKLEEENKKAEEFKKEVMAKREADVMVTITWSFPMVLIYQLSHFQPKKQEKKGLAVNASGSQDIFNAHDFDIDINVAEMGVRF